MKLTDEQLNQLASNIEGLSHIINEFDTDVQIELIKRLEANCNSLLQILKQIESNYLTYVEFMQKLLNGDDDGIDTWYSFRLNNRPNSETTEHFYNRHIEYINEIIVPNL